MEIHEEMELEETDRQRKDVDENIMRMNAQSHTSWRARKKDKKERDRQLLMGIK